MDIEYRIATFSDAEGIFELNKNGIETNQSIQIIEKMLKKNHKLEKYTPEKFLVEYSKIK